jgi:hypothetical protein
MLALEPVIKARLAGLSALTAWAVRGMTDAVDRRVVPAVDLSIRGVAVPDSKQGAVMVAPSWSVTLIVQRSDVAAEQLDTAMAQVIDALQGWAPGEAGGRKWERLTLDALGVPDFVPEGQAAIELSFSTGSAYRARAT